MTYNFYLVVQDETGFDSRTIFEELKGLLPGAIGEVDLKPVEVDEDTGEDKFLEELGYVVQFLLEVKAIVVDIIPFIKTWFDSKKKNGEIPHEARITIIRKEGFEKIDITSDNEDVLLAAIEFLEKYCNLTAK